MKRLEDESFEDYKIRRKITNKLNKAKSKLYQVFWNSSEKGTYKK